MGANEIQVLAAVLREKREALISRWREQVRKLPSAKHLDTPALDDHISALLEELSAQLERAPDSPIMEVSVKEAAPIHGIQRYEHDFDIVEVVGEYNILRGCIHALAEGNSINLRGRPLHVVNRVIDEAIAAAMQAFSARQALEAQRRREDHLAFLAHDLRTPISAISQAARAIELINPPPEDTRFAKMVNIVRRNGEHLQQLVEQMLKESAHIDTDAGLKVECRCFDLWPVVEGVMHGLQPVADTASTQLVNSVPDDLQVYADASLLKRVLQNLIANAITYAPHGTVVVGAEKLGPAGSVECWVKDDGAGIPVDQLEKIFEKGTTDHKGDGAIGLGLAIVKAVVEAHGGQVTVHSKPGHGATFRCTFPGNKLSARQTTPASD